MDKRTLHSPDVSTTNVERLAEIFPNVITESREADGPVVKSVDFDLLRQELSDRVIEGPRERFQLDWPGKREALFAANAPIAKALRPTRHESLEFDHTSNVFIEGDNLDALKLMQESYLGRIDLIYIDPPYNTGGDHFVYPDNYAENNAEYLARSGQQDADGVRLIANVESEGRFHSLWLSMMYSRLKLARNLLASTGILFISIDDGEQASLKRLCDEVYGEKNFIAQIVRNTNSSKNQSLFVSVSHEYCLVYARDVTALSAKHIDRKWSVPKNNVEEYVRRVRKLREQGMSADDITAELKILTNYPRFIDFTNYWYFDDRGLYRKDNLGGVKSGNMAPLHNPLTGRPDPIPPGGYRYSPEKLAELVADGRIHFHTDGSLPTIKRYLDENESQRPKSIMSDDQRPDYSMLQDFGTPFDNPKQLAFMKRIVGIADTDAVVLDFFAGSATTAHAVLELNAEDGGTRRFIQIQIPEKVAEGSDAAAAGYANIADIARARLRKAGDVLRSRAHHQSWNQDVGFRSFQVDTTNMADVLRPPAALDQEELDLFTSSVKPDRSGEDLLFQVLVESGLDLSLPIERQSIHGSEVYVVDGGSLIACFKTTNHLAVAREIARKAPLRVVFLDSSFTSDADRINVDQVFAEISPATEVTAI